MHRRTALQGLLALATIGFPSPRAGAAQPAMKVYRIGVLGNENNPPWDGFRHGLRELGFLDGRNVSMQWRWSEG